MDLKLSDKLDINALAAQYAVNKRGQVRDWLTPEGADRIWQCLMHETKWGLVYNRGEEPVQLSHEQVRSLKPEDHQNIAREVYSRAQNGYEYLYYFYSILESYQSGKNREFFLHRVLEFLNSEPVLDFVRKLTGIPEIIKADAHATLYQKSCFLHRHLDEHSGQGWRAAYVMNFTKDWNPNWGGFLNFYDDDMNVEEAFIPVYNAFNIFTVPKFHSVGFVPMFCPGVRLSITGWFMDK